MFYFYLFRCYDGTLYTGSTNYPPQREFRHNSGKGAQWTKQHGGGEIVYTETYPTLAEARQREIQVKKWSRIKKENLIKGKWKKQLAK
jgi:putative endonuclease